MWCGSLIVGDSGVILECVDLGTSADSLCGLLCGTR